MSIQMGCFETTVNTTLTNNSTTTLVSPNSTNTQTSARAVKIILTQSQNGSFTTPPPASGNPAAPGSGLQATQLFNPDGSVLANGNITSANWPSWLTSFEIGISGSANASSPNQNCANFATYAEQAASNCSFGPLITSGTTPCGAPAGVFRVSEADCTLGTPPTLPGNGGPSDGVYLRAYFSRAKADLGQNENILVTMEYAASSLSPAPTDPTHCYSAGVMTPENCSDFVWRVYLKHTSQEITQPFLLLVPPTFSSILPTASASIGNGSSGSGTVTKQFVLPLASDSQLSVLQISRIQSNFVNQAALRSICTLGNTFPGNSPLCSGIIIYSLTFFRI